LVSGFHLGKIWATNLSNIISRNRYSFGRSDGGYLGAEYDPLVIPTYAEWSVLRRCSS
jgi:hypothetical protein